MHSWLIPALGIFTEMQSGNRLPHALLVTAAAGLGGTDLAMEMARRFLCSGDRSEGCSCHSCSMFRVGGHPDLTLIFGSQPPMLPEVLLAKEIESQALKRLINQYVYFFEFYIFHFLKEQTIQLSAHLTIY